MSDTSQGPGWWLASDGKWYAPEQATWDAARYPAPGTPAPESATPPAGAPHPGGPFVPQAGPATGSPPYGAPVDDPGTADPAVPGASVPPPGPPGLPPPQAYGYGYGYPTAPPGYGYVPVEKTNGLAVASFVCSFFFWIWGVGSILAIVFGFIARSQIKRAGGTQKGAGLALAGIIIGFATLVLGAVIIIVVVAWVHHCDHTGTCTFNTNSGNGS